MNPSALKSWLQQSTTGAGFAAIFGTLAAASSGQITWHHAIPLLVGGAVGLIWPENKVAQQESSTLAQDLIGFIPLISAAVEHGKTLAAPAAAPAAAEPATPSSK